MIAVVASIHQPNNELINKFDKLYVPAMGGLCVYEGPPKGLKTYLIRADIVCNEEQVPIEVLIKICSKNQNEKIILSQIISNKREQLEDQCRSTFNLRHLWYHLMMRSITSTLSSQKKVLSFTFFVYIILV